MNTYKPYIAFSWWPLFTPVGEELRISEDEDISVHGLGFTFVLRFGALELRGYWLDYVLICLC
jgi:hypothetical protein